MASLPAASEAVDGLRGVKRRCTDVKIVMGDRYVYANKGVSIFQWELGGSLEIGLVPHVLRHYFRA